MILRLVVAGGLLVALGVATALYRRYQLSVSSDTRPVPTLPADLVAQAPRTWVVFTTRYCATCEPVCERLRRAYPEAAVVKVDAAVRPDLAGAFRVQRAPTALLADAAGRVSTRLVGPEAVDQYLRAMV